METVLNPFSAFNKVVAQFPASDAFYAATLDNEDAETLSQWAGRLAVESGRLVGVVRFVNEISYVKGWSVDGGGNDIEIDEYNGTDTETMNAMKEAFNAAGFETKVETDEDLSNKEEVVEYLVVLEKE